MRRPTESSEPPHALSAPEGSPASGASQPPRVLLGRTDASLLAIWSSLQPSQTRELTRESVGCLVSGCLLADSLDADSVEWRPLPGSPFGGARISKSEPRYHRIHGSGEPVGSIPDLEEEFVLRIGVESGASCIGGLHIQRSGRPFSAREGELGRRLGMALGRWIEIDQSAESSTADELRRMLERLGKALQAGAELDETLQIVADLAAEIVDGSSAAIRLIDAAGAAVVRALSGGRSIEPLRSLVFRADEGIIGSVLNEQRAQIWNDFDPSLHVHADLTMAAGIRSLICVPIISSVTNRSIGTLTVHNKRDGRLFDRTDETTLVAFATQAAVAVEKAELRSARELASDEAELLHEIAAAVNQNRLSEVLKVATARICSAVGVERCAMMLHSAPRGSLRVARACGYGDTPVDGLSVRLAEGDPLRIRLQAGVPVDLPDSNLDSVAQDEVRQLFGTDKHVLVPLIRNDSLVGAFVITQSPGSAPLSDRQCRILASVGKQIAVAIENAGLYEETERRLYELSVFQRISEAVSSSLSLKEILQRALDEVAVVMHADTGSVMLFDDERGRLKVAASFGLAASPRRRDQRLDEGVAGWVATHRQPILANNLENDPRIRLIAPRPEIASAMVVPLESKQQLMGILSVSTRSADHRYTRADLNLLQTIGSSIAVGIENAQHYDHERQIAQIARKSLLPQVPLRLPGIEIGEKHVPAQEVGGDYYQIFPLPDDRMGILVSDVSGRGASAAMHAATGKHFILALSHTLECPAKILEHANALIAHDTPTEIFISVFFGILDAATGRLQYANAGHVSPMIARPDRSIDELTSTGMVLGLWDACTYQPREAILGCGDVLLCYTDGVTEAKRGSDLFGEERLRAALMKHCHEPAQRIVDLIYRRTISYCGKRTNDDLALLAIKRTSEGH